MAKQGKRFAAASAAFDGKSNLSIEDAVALVKANASAKFDETVEIAMVLGVDPRHADQMVRGVIGLPNGTGKDVRVAVFARGAKAEEAARLVGLQGLQGDDRVVDGRQHDFAGIPRENRRPRHRQPGSRDCSDVHQRQVPRRAAGCPLDVPIRRDGVSRLGQELGAARGGFAVQVDPVAGRRRLELLGVHPSQFGAQQDVRGVRVAASH